MNNDNNNIINKYNLQNRIKWRKINYYKNIKLLNKIIRKKFVRVLFNSNYDDDDNINLDLSYLFVSCLYLVFYVLLNKNNLCTFLIKSLTDKKLEFICINIFKKSYKFKEIKEIKFVIIFIEHINFYIFLTLIK